jgi:cyclic 2,3-diphosphoglycerate synthase
VGAVFCGGAEKLPAGPLDDHYGRPVRTDPTAALRELAEGAERVVDLADEPPHPASARLRLAALALSLGLAYEAPGMHLRPPRYERVPFEGPKLGVIGTGKRTGKTAVAGHWATLLDDPVIVCMGRGGPREPRLAEPGASLEDLIAIADRGEHAASDYLEGAVLAGVRTVGCRRLGGGIAGEPAESNVVEGAALAASLSPGAIVFDGSGACIPPVEVDRTVCVAGAGADEPFAEYRLERADLVLGAGGLRFRLQPEPAEPVPDDARVSLFTTGADRCEGVEPRVVSANLADRAALIGDLERAATERCDVYLTELKAAAIDTVAAAAVEQGARVVFVRNRPLGLGFDLDAELLKLVPNA